MSTPITLRHNDDGTLDEVVASGATVHLEQMDTNYYWISIEQGGMSVHVRLRAKGAIHATVEVERTTNPAPEGADG